MVQSRRKRRIARKNKKQEKRFILIAIFVTLLFIILAYLAFIRSM